MIYIIPSKVTSFRQTGRPLCDVSLHAKRRELFPASP